MSFCCCLWLWHLIVSPVDLSPFKVSLAIIFCNFSTQCVCINSCDFWSVGWKMNCSYFVSRGQRSTFPWGRSVQLLHHVVERRPGPAGGWRQRSNFCAWPQRHLQETCCSKIALISNTTQIQQNPHPALFFILHKFIIRASFPKAKQI